MTVRHFALLFGVAYTLVGVLGFVPGAVAPPPSGAPALAVEAGYGYLLGIFPVNVLHSIVHLLVGIWGIAAYATWAASRTYARSIAVLFGLLTVMGLFPVLNTGFSLVPLFGHDIWLHALTMLPAAYFGFREPVPAAARP